ncbi:protein of unknown function [Taphrina deformans PYCC 5710]|uniref:Malic acid transport protein n=1 Tax=Taphrina deformans (strain PYCC 5710 / ATCC 11124 / CBS 356.35 / IMI 108563 / JCM 9778 / NBRC 8474) TaxID=1097556 RepID=R4XGB8_TAPDE|nr:protein of unknown function [Taphrina deformans PYCC 5710]|eukprot:CCG84947.1 protein of unknown function [Taphrina deformans PYCC 5710]
MLSGTIGSQVAANQDPKNGVPIIIAAIMMQGLGFWVSLLTIGIFIQKIFCGTKFPPPSARFGLYMFVGSPGFTTLALVACGRAASSSGVFYMDFILGTTGAGEIARVFLDLFGAFFWGLTAWLCAFASVAIIMGCFSGPHFGSEMTFSLSWFAFVFPNVGFTIGTMLLAEEFNSQALKIVTAVMTVILAIGVSLLWFGAIRAVAKRYIMMPGKDEDKPIAAFRGEFDRFEERYPSEAQYKMS